MKLSKKKVLCIFLTLVLIMINQACGKSEDSKNNFNKEIGNAVSSSKTATTKEILKASESNLVTENETID